MELELVSFEQAKALSELGFPQNSRLIETYYYDDGTLFNGCSGDYENTHNVKETFVAPFLEQAAKWLREEKKIWIDVKYNYYSMPSNYTCMVFGYSQRPYLMGYLGSGGSYSTYEESLSSGIDVALEALKHINNK